MKKITLLLGVLLAAGSVYAKDIAVKPGELDTKIKGGELNSTEIKLTGSIDARDIASLENLPPEVETLDLSEVTIEEFVNSKRDLFGKTYFVKGELPNYAFFQCGFEKLILPKDVKEIGEGVFAGSSIRSITLPEGIEKIGNFAFYGCKNLAEVSLPSTLVSLGKGSFSNCASLKEVSLQNTRVTEIPERAFADSYQLSQIVLPLNLEKVGREAFFNTGIESLDLKNVKEFEPFALSGMANLKHIDLKPGLQLPVGLLMDDTALETIGGSPESIPDYFAANCVSFDTNQALASGVTVGKYAFANNPSELLILTPGLQYLDKGVISGMAALKKIDVASLESSIPEVDETTFEGINQPEVVLFVNDDDYDLWKSHPVWGLFKVESSGTTKIEDITGTEDTILISYTGRDIKVESASPLKEVNVYSADGRRLYFNASAENTCVIPTESFPSGIVVIAVSDQNNSKKTASILIR